MKLQDLEDFSGKCEYHEDFGGQGNDIDGMNLQQMLANYTAEGVSDVNKLLEL